MQWLPNTEESGAHDLREADPTALVALIDFADFYFHVTSASPVGHAEAPREGDRPVAAAVAVGHPADAVL